MSSAPAAVNRGGRHSILEGDASFHTIAKGVIESNFNSRGMVVVTPLIVAKNPCFLLRLKNSGIKDSSQNEYAMRNRTGLSDSCVRVQERDGEDK
jgi:hypothetical protein